MPSRNAFGLAHARRLVNYGYQDGYVVEGVTPHPFGKGGVVRVRHPVEVNSGVKMIYFACYPNDSDLAKFVPLHHDMIGHNGGLGALALPLPLRHTGAVGVVTAMRGVLTLENGRPVKNIYVRAYGNTVDNGYVRVIGRSDREWQDALEQHLEYVKRSYPDWPKHCFAALFAHARERGINDVLFDRYEAQRHEQAKPGLLDWDYEAAFKAAAKAHGYNVAEELPFMPVEYRTVLRATRLRAV